MDEGTEQLTPIWTSYHSVIVRRCSGLARHSEVRKLHTSVLVREDICTFDITMYDTLLVKVNETFQHLRYIYSNEILREFPKLLADGLE